MYSSVSLANCLNHLENIYIKWFYYNTQCIEHEHVADVKKKQTTQSFENIVRKPANSLT